MESPFSCKVRAPVWVNEIDIYFPTFCFSDCCNNGRNFWRLFEKRGLDRCSVTHDYANAIADHFGDINTNTR